MASCLATLGLSFFICKNGDVRSILLKIKKGNDDKAPGLQQMLNLSEWLLMSLEGAVGQKQTHEALSGWAIVPFLFLLRQPIFCPYWLPLSIHGKI